MILEKFFFFFYVRPHEEPARQEIRDQSLSQEDPLEMGLAAPSSILTWRIPGIEERGGLQSMGWQRVRYNGVTKRTHKKSANLLSIRDILPNEWCADSHSHL